MFRSRLYVLCLALTYLTAGGVGTSAAAVRRHKPELKRVDVAPSSVVGGSSTVVTGTVTLTEPAETGGDVVDLESRDPSSVTVPANVTVPEGETTASFTVTANQVYAERRVEIRAHMGWRRKGCELKVTPFEVESFSFNPSTVTEGSVFGGFQTTAGTVTISAPAGPAGVIVQITSNSSMSIPATLTIPAGATSASFSLIPGSVTTSTVITFYATIGFSHQRARLTVLP